MLYKHRPVIATLYILSSILYQHGESLDLQRYVPLCFEGPAGVCVRSSEDWLDLLRHWFRECYIICVSSAQFWRSPVPTRVTAVVRGQRGVQLDLVHLDIPGRVLCFFVNNQWKPLLYHQ